MTRFEYHGGVIRCYPNPRFIARCVAFGVYLCGIGDNE